MTQYGRALHELGIEILCANTPAAKGRVERAHGTLQDRLVKEMRVDPIRENQRLGGKRVTVNDYPDGRIKIKYEGRELGYREFDKLTQTHQGEVVPHKRLGAMLNLICETQKLLPQEKRSIKCPTRRYPAPARLTY